ncbi:MAG TPA: arginine deiminase family protein [Bacteriovoracaceae bacterium]|nr:arginine deiminase family protein [Bacteriovoracaceae bacterium]
MKKKTIVLVRKPSPLLVQCELTHIKRETIDFPKLLDQHTRYVEALTQLGCQVKYLPDLNQSPDGVFAEDTAFVLDEVAVITRPGAVSRQSEVTSVDQALQAFRKEIHRITAPGTVDGGDILKVEKNIYIGLSTRTNEEGIKQMRNYLSPHGYQVKAVSVPLCLHLKTGVSYLGKNHLLINPEWVEAGMFPEFTKIKIDPGESFGANVLVIDDKVFITASAPETSKKLKQAGFTLIKLDISELARAEAGLTCLSLVFKE